ncbi:hypothetical protein HMPREF1340_00883 [Enterococcus faecalis ERV73]|nr:hypothetical protein HMPREF1340_00883 [Enterococcus faecalis ERV73]
MWPNLKRRITGFALLNWPSTFCIVSLSAFSPTMPKVYRCIKKYGKLNFTSCQRER